MIVPLHPCTSACKSLYLMWEHPFGKSLSTLPPFLCGTQHFKKTVEAMGYGKGINTKPILFNPFQMSNHIKLSHFWVWFWASRISIGSRGSLIYMTCPWSIGFESPDVRHWIESMDFRIEMKHLKHVETNGALECMSGSMKLLCIIMYLYISFMWSSKCLSIKQNLGTACLLELPASNTAAEKSAFRRATHHMERSMKTAPSRNAGHRTRKCTWDLRTPKQLDAQLRNMWLSL